MILLITACGSKKEKTAAPAWRLYKSSRIRFLYKEAKKLNIPFFILSAKYGLISADEIIEPYDEIMTEEKCKSLRNQIKKRLEKINPKLVLYYKGGARKEYLNCIKNICSELNLSIEVFGFSIMGDINKLEEVLCNARRKLSK